MEKLYKSLRLSGGACIAIGCIMIVTGVACGVLSVITGGRLLANKDKISFWFNYIFIWIIALIVISTSKQSISEIS